jgi:hypothetical protein
MKKAAYSVICRFINLAIPRIAINLLRISFGVKFLELDSLKPANYAVRVSYQAQHWFWEKS